MTECAHPDGVYLYDATDGEGNELVVYRCTECGTKYTEGR
jgi:hypothetical protein